jgi:thiamine biosynthesis lipoprotein
MAKLEAAAKHTDINKIIIDEEASTVFLEDPEMSLDVGAVGKGYATEQVGEIAIKNGFTSGLISVGGNVRAIGNKRASNSPWNVGIQNPDMKSEQSNLQVVNLADLSLVTSGDYERFYTVNGKNYHHIIDPETLFPSEYFTAVTIICKDSGMQMHFLQQCLTCPSNRDLNSLKAYPTQRRCGY